MKKSIVIVSVMHLVILSATAQVTSVLWGVNGEAWTNNVLDDFSDAGYMSGNVAIPTNWPVGTIVTNYGAIPNDEISDVAAFQAAIEACPPNHAVVVPAGTYWLTDWVHVTTNNNFVLRGEDMYETILYIPTNMSVIHTEEETGWNYSIGAPAGFWWVQGVTNANIENLTFEFTEDRMTTHFNHDGRCAIKYSGAEDCWIKNIYIKNSGDGISLGGCSRITAMNIILDQYKERPSEEEQTVGHHGLMQGGSGYILWHNCFITGKWQHDLITAGTDHHSVYSQIKMIDGQIDHHALNAHDNLWTDIDTGEGLRVWEQGHSTQHKETYWNIYETKGTGNTNKLYYTDPSRKDVFVGMDYCQYQPTSIGSNWWHETLDTDAMVPKNIYLAQLQKAGKWIPGPLIDFELYPPNPTNIVAVDDSYVLSSAPDANYSWSETYPCRRAPGFVLQHKANTANGYLKFDFSDAVFTNVESAVVSVRGSLSAGSSVRVTAAAITNDNWSQDTITWNTQPSESGTDLDTLTVTNTMLYEFDVTDFINQELGGNKIATIRLYQPDSNDSRASFRTHEGAVWHPTLKVVPSGDIVPPATPTGLAATPGNNSVTLDWNANAEDDLDSYTVYRSLTSGSGYTNIASGVSTHTYVDNTVANYTTYYYKVSATDTNHNESAQTAYVSVTPADPSNQAPAFSTNLVVKANAMEGVAYSATIADNASDPESDTLTFVKLFGPNWLTVATDGALSGTPTSNDTGTNTFFVQVSAAGGSDTAGLQIFVEVDTETPPIAPTGLSAVGGIGQVTLDWANNTEGDLASYSVYRSTTSSNYGSTAFVTGLTASAYVDTDIANETTYYYVVTATDIHDNESAQSGEASATPSALVTVGVTASGNAAFTGNSTQNVSESMTLKNRFGTGDADAYLRFVMDAAGDTIGGVAIGDIVCVKLNLTMVSGADGANNIGVWALDDLASPGAGFFTETSWDSTLVESNAPHGYTSVEASSLTTSLGGSSDTTFGSYPQSIVIDLDVTEFKSLITDSSNNEITLILSGDKNQTLSVASLTNTGGHGVPTLEIQAAMTLTGYDLWAAGHGVGAGTNDFDSDGMNNLYEYGLGGNPTNALDQGTLPFFSRFGNGFIYVHPKRSDDNSITYTVETTTNLLESTSWASSGYTVGGTNVTGGTLDFVTNDVDTVDSDKFIRLKIE